MSNSVSKGGFTGVLRVPSINVVAKGGFAGVLRVPSTNVVVKYGAVAVLRQSTTNTVTKFGAVAVLRGTPGVTLNLDPGVYTLAGSDLGQIYARQMNLFDELIVNGGFGTNTAGWTVVDPSTGVTFVASGGLGVLTIPAGVSGGYAYQGVSVNPGQMYRLEVVWGPGNHAYPEVQLGTHPGYDDIYSFTGTTGVESIDFVPDTDTLYISLTAGATIPETTTTTTIIRRSWRDLLSGYTLAQLEALTAAQLLALLRPTTSTTTTVSTDLTRTVEFNNISLQSAGDYQLTGTDPAMAHGRTLLIAGRTYNLTGASVALKATRLLNAPPGVYALTGSAVGAHQGRLVTVAPGAYVSAGAAVSLIAARLLDPDPGSYTVTGSSALIMRRYVMPMGLGVYSQSQSSISLLFNHLLKANPRVFSLSGTTATISYHQVTKVSPDQGVYTLTGSDVTFVYDRRLAATPGVYLVQGRSISLLATRALSFTAGSYSIWNGNLLITGAGETLLDGVGNMLISTDLSMTVGSATMGVNSAAYTVTGANIRMTVGRQMSLGSGVYAVTGTSVVIHAARSLQGSGAYTIAVSDVPMSVTRTMQLTAGLYLLDGVSATIARGYNIHNSGGLYAISGKTVSCSATRCATLYSRAYQAVWSSGSVTYERLLGGLRVIPVEIAPIRSLAPGAHNRKIVVEAQDRLVSVGHATSRKIAINPSDTRELTVATLGRTL